MHPLYDPPFMLKYFIWTPNILSVRLSSVWWWKMHHKTCLLLHKDLKILQLKIEIVIEDVVSLTFSFHNNFPTKRNKLHKMCTTDYVVVIFSCLLDKFCWWKLLLFLLLCMLMLLLLRLPCSIDKIVHRSMSLAVKLFWTFVFGLWGICGLEF